MMSLPRWIYDFHDGFGGLEWSPDSGLGVEQSAKEIGAYVDTGVHVQGAPMLGTNLP